jgi:hypothetical protein
MSKIDYEKIAKALYDRLVLKLQDEYVTMGRKHISPPTLTQDMQPALFQSVLRRSSAPKPRGTGGTQQLDGFLIIYDFQPDNGELPGEETDLGETRMLKHLANLDDALVPDDDDPYNQVQTLGGLVSHCWIEGATDLDPGVLGLQCMAVVPFHILVP